MHIVPLTVNGPYLSAVWSDWKRQHNLNFWQELCVGKTRGFELGREGGAAQMSVFSLILCHLPVVS